MAKEGSTVAGLMDSMAISVSVALQYGVPLRDLVNKFAHVRFEPSGFTGNPEIPIAKSIVDYIFRWLGSRFLPKEDREALGILDRSGDAEPEATATPASSATPPGRDAMGSPADASRAGSPAAGPAAAPAVGVMAGSAGTLAPAASAPAPVDAVGTAAAPAPEDRSTGTRDLVVEPAPSAAGPKAPGSSSPPAGSNGHAATASNGAAKSIGIQLGRSQKVAFQAQADAPSCADCGSIMVRNGSCYKCLNCGSTSGCS